MFETCPATLEVWSQADTLGAKQWTDYVKFEYNLIPLIPSTYTPIKMFHLCFLWAIWVQWCKYFYADQEELDSVVQAVQQWHKNIYTTAKQEFIKRAYELITVSQWLKILADRKANPIREKEFLLVQSQTVLINPQTLTLDEEGQIDTHIMNGGVHIY